jgi:transposase
MDSINNDDHEPIPVHHHHPAPVVGVHVNHYGHHPQSWHGHDGQPLHSQHHHYHHHEESTDAATAAALLADETTTAIIIPTLPQFHHHHDDGGAAATAAAAVALQPASPLKRTAEQDVTTLHHHELHNNNHHEAELTAAAKRQKTYPTKKERQEFTASEKLRILKLMEGSRQSSSSSSSAIVDAAQPSYTIKQLREKFGVSKSSLHRWRQQKDRLEIMVQSEGLGNRKRDTKDPLEKIKIGLQKFYNENLNKLPNEQMIITTPVVQAMACKIREELLAEYDAIVADAAAASAVGENVDGQQEQQVTPQPNLNEEELDAMRSFKITKSWASRVAISMGWFSQPRRKPTQQQQQQAQLQEHQVTHVDGSVGLDNTAADAVATIAAPEGATTTTVAVDAMTEEESNAEKAKLNTLAFLSQSHPDYSTTNPKAKKTRKEFTATEKIAIIAEMDPQQTANPLNMAEICEKYSTSKSSVFRWKQQLRAGILTQMVNEEGRGNFKRDVADKLGKVKMRLRDFIESNSCQPEERRIALTGAVLQAKAQEFRDELIAQHDADPSNSKLKEDEVEALRKFKASKGWARKAAARFGWHDVEEEANTYADGTAENAAAEAAAAARAAAEGAVDALIGHTQVVEHTHGVAATAAVPPLPGAAAAAAAPTLVAGVNYSVVDPQVTDPMHHSHAHEQQQHDHQHVQQQHHHQEIENSAAVNEAMDSVLESVGELAGSYQV